MDEHFRSAGWRRARLPARGRRPGAGTGYTETCRAAGATRPTSIRDVRQRARDGRGWMAQRADPGSAADIVKVCDAPGRRGCCARPARPRGCCSRCTTSWCSGGPASWRRSRPPRGLRDPARTCRSTCRWGTGRTWEDAGLTGRSRRGLASRPLREDGGNDDPRTAPCQWRRVPHPAHGRPVCATVAVVEPRLRPSPSACGATTEVPRLRVVRQRRSPAASREVLIDGAAYEIKMPDERNGTLLIYSHGYRQAAAGAAELPEPGDHDRAGGLRRRDRGDAARRLRARGSAYKSNGWRSPMASRPRRTSTCSSRRTSASPYRTLVGRPAWRPHHADRRGEAPEWVDGGTPCAVLWRRRAQHEPGARLSYATKTLIYPEMKLTGYTSYEESVKTWEEAMKGVVAGAQDTTAAARRRCLHRRDRRRPQPHQDLRRLGPSSRR